MIAARGVRMRMLHQPLIDLSIGCFEVGTPDVRASDIVRLTDDRPANEVHGLMIVELLYVACSSFLSSPRTLLLTLILRYSSLVFECRLTVLPLNCPRATFCS